MIDIMITTATSRRVSLSVILMVGLSSMLACSSIPGTGGDGSADPSDSQAGDQPVLSDDALPDFSIVDVNLESARYEEAVSPRDYLGQVSAWYFGHAT